MVVVWIGPILRSVDCYVVPRSLCEQLFQSLLINIRTIVFNFKNVKVTKSHKADIDIDHEHMNYGKKLVVVQLYVIHFPADGKQAQY